MAEVQQEAGSGSAGFEVVECDGRDLRVFGAGSGEHNRDLIREQGGAVVGIGIDHDESVYTPAGGELIDQCCESILIRC